MQTRRASILGMMVVAVSLSVVIGASAQQTAEPAASPPSAEPNTAPANGTGDIKLVLNFQDAPLDAVLKYLSDKASLTIVASGVSLDGRITVISRQPITVDEAVALINSTLKDKDLAAVRTGKILDITTVAKAKQRNLPVIHVTRDSDVPENKDDIMTFVIPVRYVDAQALSQNLMSLLPEYATLDANRDGNALIITDSASNVRRIMKVIQALDTHLATVAEIKVWRLTNATASSTAQLINSVFQQEAQAARSGRGGAAGGLMNMMFGGRGGRGGMGGMGGMDMTGGNNNNNPSAATRGNQAVVAAADDRTNSIVVRGPREVLDIIDGMITELDKRTTEIADVRFKQLRYADALNVAQVVNQLFGQSTTSSSSRGMQGMGPGGFMFGGRGGRGGMGGMGGMGGQQGATISSALQVTAAADSRTNTVVVTGPQAVLDVVMNVVEGLDQQIPNVADVKTFHLQYADASNTATLINEVFGASRSTSRSSSRNSSQNQQIQFGGRGGMMGGGMGQTTTSGTTSDVTVVASADTRTNSVVISGDPETLKVIADVVKELDQNPEQERRIFVYPLKNATASNLVTILNNLFTQLRSFNQTGTRTTQQFQGGTGTGGRGGTTGGATAGGGTTTSTSETNGANDLSDQTYFQADTATNSLLVLTSTKNYQLVRPIIEDLDKPVGQVLIKVLFAEITHTNNVDLGTEFSMINLRHDGGSTTTKTTFGNPGSGLSVRTLEGDLDVTLTALQKVGKLNVLSRPYVLTSNNQAATMSVAQEVPIPNGTTTVAGQTQVTFDYRNDIGIVLTVTPQVNPDGLVNMTINPKITTIGADKVQISETLFASTFSTRSATTKVAVRDGQTIVIGGLIQDQLTDTISKVPLLGDIPLLGTLFSRTIHEKDKTELLIFLTPLVAQDSDRLTPISDQEERATDLGKDPVGSENYRRHIEAMRARPADANTVVITPATGSGPGGAAHSATDQ
jgi:type II secretion system protein D